MNERAASYDALCEKLEPYVREILFGEEQRGENTQELHDLLEESPIDKQTLNEVSLGFVTERIASAWPETLRRVSDKKGDVISLNEYLLPDDFLDGRILDTWEKCISHTGLSQRTVQGVLKEFASHETLITPFGYIDRTKDGFSYFPSQE